LSEIANLYDPIEGLERNALIGTIKIKDLLAYQDQIHEQQIFVAATGNSGAAEAKPSSVLAENVSGG